MYTKALREAKNRYFCFLIRLHLTDEVNKNTLTFISDYDVVFRVRYYLLFLTLIS